MLIRFIVTNFLSFCGPTEFNMLTGNVRKKPEHVYEHDGIEFIRAAALYGANGAGKSNLVKAVAFLQDLVRGENSYNSQPFKLKAVNAKQPSVFEIEFVQNDILYYYEIALLERNIVHEALYEVNQQQEDHLLFERTTEEGKTSLVVGKEYQQNPKDQLLVELYAEKLLKREEPFLHKVVEDKIDFDKIVDAWKWIVDEIVIIYPETRANIAGILAGKGRKIMASNIKKSLMRLDTGVTSIDLASYSLEEYFGEDEEEKIEQINDFFEEKKIGEVYHYLDKMGVNTCLLKEQNGKVYIKELFLNHQAEKGQAVSFSLEEESDGTQRILDILSATQDALLRNKVVLIDEIDRSIHPSLTKAIVKSFMDAKETNGQLIFTTHEANLLDLNIFRQDEIWFAEKNKKGATTLYPLSDFKVRSDVSVKKGYLNGRFGAIPFLGDFEALNWEEEVENG